MNYWRDMSEQVRNMLAERPNVAAFPNQEIFSRWMGNLTSTARGVICNVHELKGSEFCSL
jgi:hypothetical protein